MLDICKKIILFIIIVFCIVIIGQTEVYAQTDDVIDGIIHESGVDMLDENASGNAGEFLDKHSVSAENPESIMNIGISDVIDEIIKEIKENIRLPMKMFSSLIMITILSSLTSGIGDTVNPKSAGKLFNLICVLVSVSVISEPLRQCFYNSAENIKAGAVFMTGFIPVFSGITAAAGGVSSAMSYSALIYISTEAMLYITDRILMPVLGMCMALSIVDSINPLISLNELINGFKKFVTRILTFIMMLFTGLLSIQSVIGTSSDSLAVKAGKYIASNFVPVVGSAVSDAYTTLKSSMGLLRGGTGSFGIIAVICILLPSVISAGLYYLAMQAAFICSDMFGEKYLSRLFSNMSSVLSIIFSIMVCFAVMMIISTAVVMLIGMSTL